MQTVPKSRTAVFLSGLTVSVKKDLYYYKNRTSFSEKILLPIFIKKQKITLTTENNEVYFLWQLF